MLIAQTRLPLILNFSFTCAGQEDAVKKSVEALKDGVGLRATFRAESNNKACTPFLVVAKYHYELLDPDVRQACLHMMSDRCH